VRRLVPLGLLTLVAATGCGAAHRSGAGGVISSDGRIGPPTLHLVGGHVYAFAVHSAQNDIGIFDCL
jgi:hypothetical protein